MIGLPLLNYFLDNSYKQDSPKQSVTLEKLADHADHIGQLAGSARHIALGTDSDGGFGAEHMPAELDTHRDLHQFVGTLQGRGWNDDDIALLMHGNWTRFFGETLPE